MPDRVPIGVVGLGRMGKHRANEECKNFGIKIATSTDAHASQAKEAIHKGLHVLCEKPLSIDLAETQSVIGLAKQHPELKVMVGFTRRFDPSYRDTAKKILEEESIGCPHMVRSNTCDLLNPDGFFARYVTCNGGIFVDCVIHDIDLALWYLSDPVPKSCWAIGSVQHHPELKDYGDVDNGLGVVEFRGREIAYFYCSQMQAHGFDVCTEITGTEGKVSVNVVPRLNDVVTSDKLGIRREVQPEYWHRFEESFAVQAREYVQCIAEDRPAPLPIDSGIKVTSLGIALQDALHAGKVQRFNNKGERI